MSSGAIFRQKVLARYSGLLAQNLTWEPETASTNDLAKIAAAEGAAHGSVYVAEYQSAGRGRRGNAWVAPAGQNLLFSVLLRPTLGTEYWPQYGHLAARAVLHTCQALGLPAAVKWPNDIYLNGKKVCGLLLETSSTAIILGIGLNVFGRAEAYPMELRDSVTTLEQESASVGHLAELLALLLEKLEQQLAYAGERFPEALEELWEFSWLRGQEISLVSLQQEIRGKAVGLAPNGALLVKLSDGSVKSFLSADLVRRR